MVEVKRRGLIRWKSLQEALKKITKSDKRKKCWWTKLDKARKKEKARTRMENECAGGESVE